jgi:hypothetical protein
MHNTIRTFISTLALASAVLLPACGEALQPPDAAEETEPTVTPAELGLGNDWRPVEPGLWARNDREGDPQFVGIGDAGRLHAIASLEVAEEELQSAAEASESEEARAQLAELDELITELRMSEIAAPADPELRCTPTVSASVDASPSSCGVTAKATASYSQCSSLGTVKTYAQATCGVETKTHVCGPKQANPSFCNSQVSIVGPSPCKSFAYTHISAPSVYVYIWDENLQRGSCSGPGPGPGTGDKCGTCGPNQDCHCGDVCRNIGTSCP